MVIALLLLLTTVTFVSMKGSRVALTLFALDLGAGPFETGLLFALYGLFPFLFAVHAGRIADRFGNRGLMYLGLAALTASLALPAVLPVLPALYVAAPLIGFTSMLFVVATQNLIGLLSLPGTRTRNYSLYSLGESTANVAGPILVGFIIDFRSHPFEFVIVAAITASCLAALHLGRRAIPAVGGGGREAQPDRAAADLLRLPALREALVTNGVVMTGLDLYSLYLPIYARSFGLSASAIGLILGAFGVAGFLVRMMIPPVTARWGERAMMAAALALASLAFISIPLTQSPWLLAAASFVVGLGIGCGQPLSMILAFNAAPPGRSAEAIAMRLAVSYGAHVVIPTVFGAVGAVFGFAPVFWTCAMLMGGGAYLNRRGKAGDP